MKGKIYKTVMLYCSETWTMTKADTRKIAAAETRMLRWTTGVTLKDRVRNEDTLAKLKVRKIEDKIIERRLRWHGHVLRRDDDDEIYAGKLAKEIEIGGKRKRGRPRKRWLDDVVNDMKACGLTDADAKDRKRWRILSSKADPD